MMLLLLEEWSSPAEEAARVAEIEGLPAWPEKLAAGATSKGCWGPWVAEWARR